MSALSVSTSLVMKVCNNMYFSKNVYIYDNIGLSSHFALCPICLLALEHNIKKCKCHKKV